jgi:hypothetical protein
MRGLCVRSLCGPARHHMRKVPHLSISPKASLRLDGHPLPSRERMSSALREMPVRWRSLRWPAFDALLACAPSTRPKLACLRHDDAAKEPPSGTAYKQALTLSSRPERRRASGTTRSEEPGPGPSRHTSIETPGSRIALTRVRDDSVWRSMPASLRRSFGLRASGTT